MKIQDVVFAENDRKDNLIALVRTTKDDFFCLFPSYLENKPSYFLLEGVYYPEDQERFKKTFGDYRCPLGRFQSDITRSGKINAYGLIALSTRKQVESIVDELLEIMFGNFLEARNKYIAPFKVKGAEAKVKKMNKTLANLQRKIDEWGKLA